MTPLADLEIRLIDVRIEFQCGCLMVRQIKSVTPWQSEGEKKFWGHCCEKHRQTPLKVERRALDEIQAILKEPIS